MTISSLLQISSSGLLGIGTNPTQALHVQGSTIVSGAIGIGSTSPGFRLVVNNGNTAGINAVIQASGMVAGDTTSILLGKELAVNNCGTILWNHVANGSATNFLGLGYYAGDNKLNLTCNGRVGVGITNPSEPLSVVGNVYSYNGVFLVNNTATYQTVGVQINNTNASTTIQLSVSGTTGWASAGTFGIYNGCGTNGGFPFNILPNGNVGIGTTNPSQTLEVVGTVRATGYNLSGYNLLVPKMIYVSSQLLNVAYSGTTTASGVASFSTLIGAYEEGLIGGTFIGGINPDTSQYFKAYYISCQVTTDNNCGVGVGINNTVVISASSWSSPTFRVVVRSGFFLNWTQFPYQGAAGYSGYGLNLQLYQANTTVVNFQVNYITVHCVYLHTSYTDYPTIAGLSYNNSYRQFS